MDGFIDELIAKARAAQKQVNSASGQVDLMVAAVGRETYKQAGGNREAGKKQMGVFESKQTPENLVHCVIWRGVSVGVVKDPVRIDWCQTVGVIIPDAVTNAALPSARCPHESSQRNYFAPHPKAKKTAKLVNLGWTA